VEVRERLADHLDAAPDRVGPRGGVEDDRVVRDDVRIHELVDDVELPLVKALVVEPADEGLVGFERVGHRRIVRPYMRGSQTGGMQSSGGGSHRRPPQSPGSPGEATRIGWLNESLPPGTVTSA
jgi:hypothetical protein